MLILRFKAMFLPFPTRVIVILHLSFAFTLLMWYAFSPFFKEHWELKSRLLLYENVMNRLESPPITSLDQLKRNEARFLSLEEEIQEQVVQGYNLLLATPDKAFLEKTKKSVQAMTLGIPAFALAWVFFSTLICIFLLCRIEGAIQAAYLLPFLALCYAFFNLTSEHTAPLPADSHLYPAEGYLIEHYSDSLLSNSILEQHKQLLHAWEIYLISEWTDQSPTHDADKRSLQIEEGEFYFNLARIKTLENTPIHQEFFIEDREWVLSHIIYIAWNFFFLWFLTRKKALAFS